MSHLSAEIRCKNNWWLFCGDQKWREDLLEETRDRILRIDTPYGKAEVILNNAQVRRIYTGFQLHM